MFSRLLSKLHVQDTSDSPKCPQTGLTCTFHSSRVHWERGMAVVNKLFFSDKQDPFDLITALLDIEVTSNKWQSAERHPEEDCLEKPTPYLLDLLNFFRCHLIRIDVPDVHTVYSSRFFLQETVLTNDRLIHSCQTAQLAGFQLNYEPLIMPFSS